MRTEKRENIFVRGWRRGRAAWGVLTAHRFTTVAGTLVFFLIMSLVPFLFWLSLLFGGADALLDRVLELELFGWARDLISFLRTNAEGATAGASIFLIATTLWSSSAFFFHLRRSGEIIYEVRRKGKGLRVRFAAIGFMILEPYASSSYCPGTSGSHTCMKGGVLTARRMEPALRELRLS